MLFFKKEKNKNPELKNFEISITTSEKAQNNAKDIQFKKPGVDRNKNAKIINVEKRIYIFIASIDIACVIVDLFCVTMLYFDVYILIEINFKKHFSLVRNKYQFTSNSNRLRFICLGLSLMVILLLIQRMKLILKRDILRNNALYPKSNRKTI